MEHPVTLNEARAALDAVDRGRRRVIDEIDLPRWYWFGLALGWIALGVVTVGGSLALGGVVALGFVTVGGSLALRADGARHPVTITSVFVAVIVVLGGPQLLAAVRRRAARNAAA
jgi:hypothetical protein